MVLRPKLTTIKKIRKICFSCVLKKIENVERRMLQSSRDKVSLNVLSVFK